MWILVLSCNEPSGLSLNLWRHNKIQNKHHHFSISYLYYYYYYYYYYYFVSSDKVLFEHLLINNYTFMRCIIIIWVYIIDKYACFFNNHWMEITEKYKPICTVSDFPHYLSRFNCFHKNVLFLKLPDRALSVQPVLKILNFDPVLTSSRINNEPAE